MTLILQLDRPASTSESVLFWLLKNTGVTRIYVSIFSCSVGTDEIQTFKHSICSGFPFRGSQLLHSLLSTIPTVQQSAFNYNAAFCFSFSSFAPNNNHK